MIFLWVFFKCLPHTNFTLCLIYNSNLHYTIDTDDWISWIFHVSCSRLPLPHNATVCSTSVHHFPSLAFFLFGCFCCVSRQNLQLNNRIRTKILRFFFDDARSFVNCLRFSLGKSVISRYKRWHENIESKHFLLHYNVLNMIEWTRTPFAWYLFW